GGCAMNGSFPALELTHHRGAFQPRQLLARSFATRTRALPEFHSASRARHEKRARNPLGARGAPRLTRCGSKDRAARSAEAGRQPRVGGEVAVGLAIGA